jgi:hypothetical protein
MSFDNFHFENYALLPETSTRKYHYLLPNSQKSAALSYFAAEA